MRILKIKWSVSRGRDTYGWNICTLYDGDRAYRTKGGGYDMVGTVFGEWLLAHYSDKIEKLDQGQFYGLECYNGQTYLDGACGLNCMIKIAKAIGLGIREYYNQGDLKKIEVYHNFEEVNRG